MDKTVTLTEEELKIVIDTLNAADAEGVGPNPTRGLLDKLIGDIHHPIYDYKRTPEEEKIARAKELARCQLVPTIVARFGDRLLTLSTPQLRSIKS